MEQPLRFNMLRPDEVEGDLAWAWHRFERDQDRPFWETPLLSCGYPREFVFLGHWLTDTASGHALRHIASDEPLLDPEEHAYFLEALHADACAYQELVRDGLPGQIPVAETSALVPVVIHLIRGWYPVEDVLESFRVLAAWEAEATEDDVLNALESLPHPELPAHAVLDRLRLGERPPIKPPRVGSSEATLVDEALWRTLEGLCASDEIK
ncbi:hypothetical protein ACTQ49_05400 [Luteococcus sp. Sow4_B9]|uniref:hypothetical protein n=1 Tax=Luteococcus sp. Sow4_B9 TaxID=3438792 RepID=UPI003F9C6F30